ncbi:Uncharacterized protein Rs2_47300 [Raphanus sativus]|nr:Uncharacterized protein Rs2_47300 [Raphanus sativus]
MLVVEAPYRFQQGGTCWVFGIGRYHNAHMQTPCGGIPNLEAARDCLVNHGLPLESAIPGQDPLYAVRDMIVHHAQRYPTYQEFEQHLFTLMLGSPVAAAVLSFPSLFEGPDRNGLHYPTPAERLLGLDAYVSHVMLATGRGSMRERGPTRELLEFLEFQDSMPGNGGVIKLRLGPNERTVLRGCGVRRVQEVCEEPMSLQETCLDVRSWYDVRP